MFQFLFKKKLNYLNVIIIIKSSTKNNKIKIKKIYNLIILILNIQYKIIILIINEHKFIHTILKFQLKFLQVNKKHIFYIYI